MTPKEFETQYLCEFKPSIGSIVVPSEYINYAKTSNGKVRAICECCGKKSLAVLPDEDGEPPLWRLAAGWWQAPYPADFIHSDGSIGSNYTCPGCHKKMQSGQSVKLRSYDV
jgi:hypothetical protein